MTSWAQAQECQQRDQEQGHNYASIHLISSCICREKPPQISEAPHSALMRRDLTWEPVGSRDPPRDAFFVVVTSGQDKLLCFPSRLGFLHPDLRHTANRTIRHAGKVCIISLQKSPCCSPFSSQQSDMIDFLQKRHNPQYDTSLRGVLISEGLGPSVFSINFFNQPTWEKTSPSGLHSMILFFCCNYAKNGTIQKQAGGLANLRQISVGGRYFW